MLAQNFKTPAELGISDHEFDALYKVLGMLERGELTHGSFRRIPDGQEFNMDACVEEHPCGTVACILGWARIISSHEPLFCRLHLATRQLNDLFMVIPTHNLPFWAESRATVTPAQAALALRSYLTDGDPRWAEALCT